jgi:hypothetical protein
MSPRPIAAQIRDVQAARAAVLRSLSRAAAGEIPPFTLIELEDARLTLEASEAHLEDLRAAERLEGLLARVQTNAAALKIARAA